MANSNPNKTTQKKLVKFKTWFTKLLTLLGRQPKNIDDVMTMLRDAEDREVLTGEMLGMFERILHVADMQVRDVMIPKSQMVAVKKEDPLEKILPVIIESGHSRFPVVDHTGKEVVGILLAKDLIQYSFHKSENQPFNLKAIIRPVIFTPQSKRLDILLREFRSNRNHMAIVLDEYGNVEGLVTIEDVLEQIVGEIADEYDSEEADSTIKKLDDGSFIVKAATLIKDFNEYFHTDYSDAEFDTIGGIVLQAFGHLPKRGEKIKLAPLRFKVLHSDSRRIYLLEVQKI